MPHAIDAYRASSCTRRAAVGKAARRNNLDDETCSQHRRGRRLALRIERRGLRFDASSRSRRDAEVRHVHLTESVA